MDIKEFIKSISLHNDFVDRLTIDGKGVSNDFVVIEPVKDGIELHYYYMNFEDIDNESYYIKFNELEELLAGNMIIKKRRRGLYNTVDVKIELQQV
ncbi:hypothetical protein [Cysteiniphilum marinum]|uniref:hypothetical protein n=1 Tax=Cysteiniphilum marinum TaxID=2774191 RepID=UPI001939ABD2|nr:hypothetical protein [Cysteiniphilum marinum]